jgi:hypothetical protein
LGVSGRAEAKKGAAPAAPCRARGGGAARPDSSNTKSPADERGAHLLARALQFPGFCAHETRPDGSEHPFVRVERLSPKSGDLGKRRVKTGDETGDGRAQIGRRIQPHRTAPATRLRAFNVDTNAANVEKRALRRVRRRAAAGKRPRSPLSLAVAPGRGLSTPNRPPTSKEAFFPPVRLGIPSLVFHRPDPRAPCILSFRWAFLP